MIQRMDQMYEHGVVYRLNSKVRVHGDITCGPTILIYFILCCSDTIFCVTYMYEMT